MFFLPTAPFLLEKSAKFLFVHERLSLLISMQLFTSSPTRVLAFVIRGRVSGVRIIALERERERDRQLGMLLLLLMRLDGWLVSMCLCNVTIHCQGQNDLQPDLNYYRATTACVRIGPAVSSTDSFSLGKKESGSFFRECIIVVCIPTLYTYLITMRN